MWLRQSVPKMGITTRLLPPTRWNDARIATYLFLSFWLTYGFLGWKFQGSNAITRMVLIFSILQHHSLTIDQFAPFTVDKTLFEGHFFADKPPGMSFSALPAVAVFDWMARALHFATRPITAGWSRCSIG
jgi:hypothetical protein